MKKILKSIYGKYILFGILISLTPVLQSVGIIRSATITIFGTIIFYAIVGIGLNVLLGYSGLVSLGTAGFMGLGAYLSAYLTDDMNLPFIISLIISVAIPLAIGLIIGLVSLRIEGYYLAIATLGVAEIFRQVFIEFDAITGGFSGKNASYPRLFNIIQLDRQLTFILMSIILVAVMILTYNFIHGATGRALLTMRGSEAAAQAMGINILKYKLIAFAVATLYAGLGGVLYVHFIRFAYPATWSLTLSLQVLAVIVIGGMRTISGPIIGAFIVFGIPELVLKQLPVIGNIDGLSFIFTGILIIVVILFYPNGLIHLGSDVKKFIDKRRQSNIASEKLEKKKVNQNG
ncbi:branched-chain amino acid ABC transporter permease [Maledivibacter halophilus]|uniref:Amino acid/amide ABC transporter membrane protein 2, HAAT family n=1 Tax=Maledivibacter halophilus TaxID=36842 RepID=A0A1T5J9Q6_9FIRM|nr:branched-chain amino acid ABC transporter permease [Maledivibacter halophilus]SKC47973.1 amino acid/amide ABC transporter membrane protein 2, HAAT family [Maledivibacter halophilus]